MQIELGDQEKLFIKLSHNIAVNGNNLHAQIGEEVKIFRWAYYSKYNDLLWRNSLNTPICDGCNAFYGNENDFEPTDLY